LASVHKGDGETLDDGCFFLIFILLQLSYLSSILGFEKEADFHAFINIPCLNI
jgi:hypothetical protein